MIGQVFQVLTEFKFEVGSAIANTQQLKGAVDQVSLAADNAIFSFQRLGFSIASSITAGSGGLLGGLYQSIKAADKFRSSQIAIANLMFDGATPFNSRLEMAETTMENINKLAAEFALPADELLNLSKLVAPMIRTHGKNGAVGGPDFNTAIDVSRNLLKAAPTLGIDPTLVTGQLQRAIGGQASMGDTLFSRLVADTKGMRGMTSQKFNAMPEVERVHTLRQALKEFTSDTQVLQANVKTLRGQMQLLSDAFSGTFSILRPIGQTLLGLIIPMLERLNMWLRASGAMISRSLARALEPLVKTPEMIFVNLKQLSRLKDDVKLSGTILGIVGLFVALNHALKFFGFNLMATTRQVVLSSLGMGAAGGLGGLSLMVANFGGFIGLMVKFGSLLTVILGPFVLLVGFFQLISRAVAIAQVADASRLVQLMPRISEIMARITNLFDIFLEGFDNIARFISPIFELGRYFEFLTDVVEGLVTLIALAVAGFQGLVFAVGELVTQIASLFTGGGFSFAKIGEAFDAGATDVIEKVFGRIKTGDAIATNVTNIGKVEIRNDFKEQQEPDRIAFTMKEQILKAAQNPTQSRGTSFQSAFAR